MGESTAGPVALDAGKGVPSTCCTPGTANSVEMWLVNVAGGAPVAPVSPISFRGSAWTTGAAYAGGAEEPEGSAEFRTISFPLGTGTSNSAPLSEGATWPISASPVPSAADDAAGSLYWLSRNGLTFPPEFCAPRGVSCLGIDLAPSPLCTDAPPAADETERRGQKVVSTIGSGFGIGAAALVLPSLSPDGLFFLPSVVESADGSEGASSVLPVFAAAGGAISAISISEADLPFPLGSLGK